MYKPRPAAWPGFPRSAGIDEYVPRDHLDRALTAAAATGISEEWTVPLTRCGEPARPVPLPEPRRRTRRRAA